MLNRFIDQTLRRIPVRLRIVGAFLQVLLLTGLLSFLVVGNFNAVVNRLEQFTNVDAKIERLLLLTSRRVATSQLNLNRYIQDYVPSPYEALDDVDQAITELKGGLEIAINPQATENISLIIQSLESYQADILELQRTRAEGDSAQATRLEARLQRLGNDIGLRLELIVNNSVQEATTVNQTVLRDAQSSLSTGVILLIVGLLLVAVLSYLTTVSITRPLADLRSGTLAFQQGDLYTEIKTSGRDEMTGISEIFNNLARRIRELISNLEQRVADRTRALATSTEVSRRLSTILDQKELVSEVVNQVKDAFGYYHTQIYFFDDARQNLVMTGGTGEAGVEMLTRRHKISLGRGLVGQAAETRQVVLVSDTYQNPDWLPNPLLPDTRSEIAIPISLGEEVLGVLDVQHNVTDGLQQSDVDSLQSIANQVAVAIQNIRQYQGSQKIAAEMGVVANVGIATSTIIDPDLLLQEVVDLSKKSFDLYHAHIYLLDAEGQNLVLSAGAGEVGRQMVTEKRSIPLNREQSLVARAARTRQGVVVNDVTTAPDFLPNPLLPETRSEMAVPMIVADQVIGVLDVQSEQYNHFTEVDVSIQTTLASQVAVALQNARSFAQTQSLAQRETAVNTISQKIQSAASVEDALQIAVRELGRALGSKPTQVTLNPRTAAKEAGQS